MTEIVMWQYRWLNPGNAPNPPPSMLEWKEVEHRNHSQTMKQRIEELRDFRYDGKPAYEVRALGVITPGVPVVDLPREPWPFTPESNGELERRRAAAGVPAVDGQTKPSPDADGGPAC